MNTEVPILQEGGLMITPHGLRTQGRSFEFRRIYAARIERIQRGGALALLFKSAPLFRLVVLEQVDASPMVLLETTDKEFAGRIQRAMDSILSSDRA